MPLGANKAAIMGVAGVSTADVVLLSSQIASGDSTLDFSSDITSTYGEYIFRFYNINVDTDGTTFGFQANGAGESDYDETITSTFCNANHAEADNWAQLSYNTGSDQGEGTAFQHLNISQSDDADSGLVGELHLFNPASTTYVKHFFGRTSAMWYTTNQPQYGDAFCADFYVAGYFNTTTAIDDIQFKAASGNFDGTIKMWGVK